MILTLTQFLFRFLAVLRGSFYRRHKHTAVEQWRSLDLHFYRFIFVGRRTRSWMYRDCCMRSVGCRLVDWKIGVHRQLDFDWNRWLLQCGGERNPLGDAAKRIQDKGDTSVCVRFLRHYTAFRSVNCNRIIEFYSPNSSHSICCGIFVQLVKLIECCRLVFLLHNEVNNKLLGCGQIFAFSYIKTERMVIIPSNIWRHDIYDHNDE